MLFTCSAFAPRGARAEGSAAACEQVEAAIASFPAMTEDGAAWLRLASFMSPGAVPGLLATTADEADRRAFDAYLTLGFSRESRALVALGSVSPRSGRFRSLGRALALLALGDGSQSATVAAALAHGALDERREVARALGRMRQVRPARILESALHDPDDMVRFYAARGLLWTGKAQARAVLRALAVSGAARARAARLIIDAELSVPLEVADRLPEPSRGRARVALVARGHRALSRKLPSEALSGDPATRAAAFAGLVFSGSTKQLGVIGRRAVARYGASAEAEEAMALALIGEDEGLVRLTRLGAGQVEPAVAVLWAYSGAREASAPKEQVGRLGQVLEHWVVTGAVGARAGSRTLRALELLDAEVAREVARARLLGPDGWPLRTAIRVLGRHGSSRDVGPLLRVAGRRGASRTRAEALRAAARICAR